MHKLKILLIFMLFVFNLPTIMAVGFGEESLIKSYLKIYFERLSDKEAILRLESENLDWSKAILYNESIDNTTGEIIGFDIWNEKIDLIFIRQLGNYTDVQFLILECNEMANFSNKWEKCIEQRNELMLSLENEMINKSEYYEMETNLTTQTEKYKNDYINFEKSKIEEITKLKSENETLKTHRQYGWGIGIVGFIVASYTLWKYTGFGKRKHQEEMEISRDTTI